MEENKLWWQIIVADPESLTGDSIKSVIDLLLAPNKDDIVVAIADADWMKHLLNTSVPSGDHVLISTTGQLRTALESISQIDWGHFFFCENPNQANKITKDEPMVDSIGKSFLSISLLDQSLLYVYTQDDNIPPMLRERCDVLEVAHEAIEDLLIP